MRDRQSRWMCWPAAALAVATLQGNAHAAAGTSYSGMAEASAATMLDDRHFVVAEDECNTLLVYARDQSKPIGLGLNLAEFLGTGDKASDIEGGAIIGDIVYWISSHSLPKSGKPREWRKQFFATRVSKTGAAPTVVTHERPYTGLLEAMIKAPELTDLKLAHAANILPEQPGGLNIEGLAAWKGDNLLIGFRNPLVGGKAPLVSLTNPAEVIKGKGFPAKFDAPILVDLGGRGVRSIDKIGNEYLIVGGPVVDTGSFALFRWTGDSAIPPQMMIELPSGYFPEALLSVPGSKEVELLSDDGSKQPEAACGSVEKAKQQFRMLRVRVP